MTPDQLASVFVIAPAAFIAALLFLPIDLWLLPFRMIGIARRALIWPITFLASLSDPEKADRHRAWWAARAVQFGHLARAVLGRP